MFSIKNYSGYNVPMLSALKSQLQCVKLVLNKLRNNQQILNDILKEKDNADRDLVALAFMGKSKKYRIKVSKLILSYYSEEDVEAVFLPAIRLGINYMCPFCSVSFS